MKLCVKLQTPTIELKITAKDAAGVKDSFLVGFKRYEISATDAKLKELQAVMQETIEDSTESGTAKLSSFIKGEIAYLKQIKLDLVDENGATKEITVLDTRTVKPNETLWGTPDECLAVLLDLYLASAPYRVSLISAMQKALLNNDYSEAEAKN